MSDQQQRYPIVCRIRAQDDGPTRVDVYDDIGGPGGQWAEMFGGVCARDFAAQLAPVTGALEVHINSAGGEVFDGIAIAQAVRSHAGPVTTVVDGIAASIASVIAQAGEIRVMAPGSMMMIHDALSGCCGNEAEMQKMAGTLGKVSDNLAGIYADRAGGTAAQWREAMRAETWYTAEEAVAAGLADRTGDGPAQLPAGLDVAALTRVPGRIAAALRSMPRDGAHPPMTGTHSHAHPAYGSQGSDATHDHQHEHGAGGAPDAHHGHGHDAGPQDQGARIRAASCGCCDACTGPGCGCCEMCQPGQPGEPDALAEDHNHPGEPCWDPDGDGDCDLTPQADADHDYWAPDGTQLRPVPGRPMGGQAAAGLGAAIRAAVRDELRAAGLMKEINPDYEPEDSTSRGIAAAGAVARFRAALRGEQA